MKKKILIIVISSLIATTTVNANPIVLGSKIAKKIWEKRDAIGTALGLGYIFGPSILSAAGLDDYDSYPMDGEIDEQLENGSNELRLKVCKEDNGDRVAVPKHFKVCPNGSSPYNQIIKIP